jgi:uncharacterized protein RhaS with RHS repeats
MKHPMLRLALIAGILILSVGSSFARYYDSRIGRFLSVDPHSGRYVAWSPYTYALDNPLKYVDPNGKDAIPIVFKDYKISAFGIKWSGLGHAGILLIDNKTGLTKYYEYGRYDKEGKGWVRQHRVSNVAMDKKTGMPTAESLTKVLGEISKAAGQGGDITGAYVKNDNFKEMNDHAQQQKSENSNPNRDEYSLTGNNCGTFVKETLEAGKADTPSMIDPRPNSYIEEIRDMYPDVDYNASKMQTTVEKEEKKRDGN